MKKQNGRKANGTKSGFPPSTGGRDVPQAGREASTGIISFDGAVDLIRAEAYRLFEFRGRQPGHEMDDWLQTERETFRQSSAAEDRRFT